MNSPESALTPSQPRLNHLVLAITLPLLAAAFPAMAAPPLRMAIGTMSYPMEAYGSDGIINGGLLKDLGEHLAAKLGTQIVFVKQSRRRIESGLLAGSLDITCYSHPTWWDSTQPALWSIPTIPQIERVVGLRNEKLPSTDPEDFAGKRVAVHTGYHFPMLQPLFDSGIAKRLDENQVPMLFKAVETKLADILITSDAEIEGYLNENPDKRNLFSVAREPFSIVPTQCAVSPRSEWKLESINSALRDMMRQGEFDRLTKKYGLTMQ